VNSTMTGAAPPGWYPDPAGERQWRVWTGDRWSELTRPYATASMRSDVSGDLGLIKALYRLVRYGIVAAFTGLGSVVGVLAHWPGTAHPVTPTFAAIGIDAGLSLLIFGTICFAFAARELEGRWTLWALIPAVNFVGVNALITRRLGGRPLQRVSAEIILLALFAARFHAQPWLCIAPVIAAVGQLGWTTSLIQQLSGTATVSPPVVS
jgi:hypothetical protein